MRCKEGELEKSQMRHCSGGHDDVRHCWEGALEKSQNQTLCGGMATGDIKGEMSGEFQTQEIKQDLQVWEKELILIAFARTLMSRM